MAILETLTVQRLGLTGALQRTLRTTNIIENLIGNDRNGQPGPVARPQRVHGKSASPLAQVPVPMPEANPWGPKPDMLTGYDNAGESFGAVLRDAERRLLLAGERNYRNLVVPARLTDLEVHTQHRSTYAEPKDKQRIVRAADQILQETVLDDEPEAKLRFDEALAVMEQEDERIFVVTLTGNIWDFVYWEWRHGYTIDAWERSTEWKRFHRDVRRRKVAAPELARAAYQPVEQGCRRPDTG